MGNGAMMLLQAMCSLAEIESTGSVSNYVVEAYDIVPGKSKESPWKK